MGGGGGGRETRKNNTEGGSVNLYEPCVVILRRISLAPCCLACWSVRLPCMLLILSSSTYFFFVGS